MTVSTMLSLRCRAASACRAVVSLPTYPVAPRPHRSTTPSRSGASCGCLAAKKCLLSGPTSGNCGDNAVMESFFSTMKTERCNRTHYATREAARADIFDYIERFYNPTRRHSTLGNKSPINFERAAVA